MTHGPFVPFVVWGNFVNILQMNSYHGLVVSEGNSFQSANNNGRMEAILKIVRCRIRTGMVESCTLTQ